METGFSNRPKLGPIQNDAIKMIRVSLNGPWNKDSESWFHHAFMVDHAQPRSHALEFLNPCFKSFQTMSLTSLRHSLGKNYLLVKSVIGLKMDQCLTDLLLRMISPKNGLMLPNSE